MPRPTSLHLLSLLSLLSLALFSTPSVAGRVELTPQTLKAGGQVLHTLTRDVDGDGVNELLAVARAGRPNRPKRMLYVWKAGPKGFDTQPTATLTVPGKVVGIDVCNVDPMKGAEIVYLHGKGVDVVGQTKPLSFEARPRTAIEVSSSLAFADPLDAPFVELCRWPKGAAAPELWIPTWTGVQVYRIVDSRPVPDADLKVRPSASHLVPDEFRGPRARRDYAVLTTLAYPQLFSVDADGDGDDDVYANIEDRVWLFLRDGGKLSGSPAARRFFGMRTDEEFRQGQNRLQVYFGDVTGDKLPDAVAIKCTGRISSLKTEMRVYQGKGAQGFEQNAVATRKHDGYAVPEGVVDLDGDGVMEILEPALDTGPASVAQLVMTLTIDMDFHALRLKNNKFVEGEAMELTFGFEFGGSGVMGTLPLFGEDIDGDGLTDRVDLGLGDKALVFLGQKGDPAYDDDEAWEREVNATQKASWYVKQRGRPASVVIYRPKDKEQGNEITVLWNPKG
jgi:hypothetical protein